MSEGVLRGGVGASVCVEDRGIVFNVLGGGAEVEGCQLSVVRHYQQYGQA